MSNSTVPSWQHRHSMSKNSRSLSNASSSGDVYISSHGTASATIFTTTAPSFGTSTPSTSAEHISKIEDAVFSHIQALRSLGNRRVNTMEIAEALGIPHRNVESVIRRLIQRGVKLPQNEKQNLCSGCVRSRT